MQKQHITRLISNLDDPDAVLIETHISWVVLTREFAYKVKKPVKYSFLDFSSLARRRYFCFREVELNRRLSNNVYLGVVEVRQEGSRIYLDSRQGTLIDFAVKMQRLDKSRQMHLLLQQDAVTREHMEQIADQLSAFHASTDAVVRPPDVGALIEDFKDISTVADEIRKFIGKDAVGLMKDSIDVAEQFLRRHMDRIVQRHDEGFFVDGHGDLHSRNIFLLDAPVIFDCIEFNDHFRQLDVLDELAFFGLDLDLYGRQDLESYFLNRYLAVYPCIHNDIDQRLFLYYKLYRANVKTKVHALKARQAGDGKELTHRAQRMEGYYALFRKYLAEISASVVAN